MSASKIKIDWKDGKPVASATMVFGLGEVHQKRKKRDDGKLSIYLPPGVSGMKEHFYRILQSTDGIDNPQGFKDFLDTYCRYWLLDMIGLEVDGLSYNEDGKLEGVREGVEVFDDKPEDVLVLGKDMVEININKSGKVEVVGYYVDNDAEPSPNSVFVALKNEDGSYECYVPEGQHSKLDFGYFAHCRKITREEYLTHSKGFYTPGEYVEEGLVE